MAKTRLQELQDKKLDVQFQLDKVIAKITSLTPQTIPEHLEYNRNRSALDRELSSNEADKEALTKHLERLDKEIETLTASKGAKKNRTSKPKQEKIFKAVEAMRKKTKMTKEKCIEALADESGDSQEAVRKAYYAEQKKRHNEKIGKHEPDDDSKPK